LGLNRLSTQEIELYCLSEQIFKAASTNLPASSHSNSMAPSFIFEPPREEEVELSEAEGQEEEEKEASEDEGGGGEKPLNQRQKQSPWDFASYS